MRKTIFIFTILLSVSALYLNAQDRPNVRPKPIKADTSFVLVGGGTFTMGTDQPVEACESPAHQVIVHNFYLKKTEVTFAEYDRFTKATGRDTVPSGVWGRGYQPVFMVSWWDAIAYCNWLSKQHHLSPYYRIHGTEVVALDTARGYRLPTEAEWEYAARGGMHHTPTTYSGSDTIGLVGWYAANSEGKPHPVRQKEPNALGLYDMTGNVWEWVWDIYDGNYYKTSSKIDPQGPATGPYRVMRGGAWYNKANYARVVTRQNASPWFRQNSVGFRIARNSY